MRCGIVTLFPAMFDALNSSMPGKAQQTGLLQLAFFNPRDFTTNVHRTVDDRPYGGGPGMVMMAEPLLLAISEAKDQLGKQAYCICLSPQGTPLTQARVTDLAKFESIILICGRYEGIDQRILDTAIDEQISLGDYIISGGELAAMTLIDAMIRLLPGVLGHSASATQDSFNDGLLEYPQYTRPEKFAGFCVPDVLLSGNHLAIATWRRKQALGRTWLQRPDLLARKVLTDAERVLLNEFIQEHNNDRMN
jgi:tRNA (guanine37-N1)-methyltransferase